MSQSSVEKNNSRINNNGSNNNINNTKSERSMKQETTETRPYKNTKTFLFLFYFIF